MTSKDCRINPLSGRAIIVGGPTNIKLRKQNGTYTAVNTRVMNSGGFKSPKSFGRKNSHAYSIDDVTSAEFRRCFKKDGDKFKFEMYNANDDIEPLFVTNFKKLVVGLSPVSSENIFSRGSAGTRSEYDIGGSLIALVDYEKSGLSHVIDASRTDQRRKYPFTGKKVLGSPVFLDAFSSNKLSFYIYKGDDRVKLDVNV